MLPFMGRSRTITEVLDTVPAMSEGFMRIATPRITSDMHTEAIKTYGYVELLPKLARNTQSNATISAF